MCSDTILIRIVAIVTVVGASAAAVGGAPVYERRSMDLQAAVNKTLCPFEVELDDVPDRVPRLIKHVKCAGDVPRRGCTERHTSDPECCESRDHRRECVQLYDTVTVKLPEGERLHPVSVGCACIGIDAAPVEQHRGPM